ncbi:zinc-binding alcohol dehydrogenase family protein [Plantactinospora sp. B5E13]|uniref:zinc-binding alcohol dehydrogenase family protein n=1 Tax=unclassified Plantactinospora TaxID=2631981 RepID=UPI00325F59BB
MTELMPAVGYRRSLPVNDPESLVDTELPVPVPGPHDLLVRVEAVSVNPVDTKVRANVAPAGDEIKVLGYDAAGVVVAVGSEVTRFRVGDEVYYAGSIGRPGSNSRFHAVDEHVVGHKPTSLSFAEAAAIPLTAITAWEALFDSFALTRQSTGTLLVLGGAGGVGSMAIQLARTLTDLTVVATASRPESRQWATDLGAHHVADHRDLVESVRAVAPAGVDYLISPFTAGNIERYAEIVRPRGHIVALDEPAGLELLPLKAKSIGWHWEFMFTRPLFLPTDPTQHDLLEQVARLVDEGRIRTTLTTQLGPIDAANLRHAHELLESSTTIGKVVLAGF